MHQERLWAGSPAGLFVLQDNGLRPVAREVPFWGVNALGQAGNSLLVAGLPHGLIRSSDGGRHWLRSTITHTQKPITCLAASPNVRSDGVVLAGTAGDGMLRSTDGGRYWELVNFGLRDFDVLGIACSPLWKRREFAVAATTQGLYQSPNGGRAWRQAKLPAEVAPQAVCFSQNFADDGTVFAGTEGSGLLVSHDQGLCWEKDGRFPQNLSVTWLGYIANQLVATTGDGQLFSSNDHGQSWQAQQLSQQPILAVGGTATESWVGLAEDGLLTKANIPSSRSRASSDASPFASEDANSSLLEWQPVANVTARRFSHFAATTQLWAAISPLDGIFVSRDAGKSWQQLAKASAAAQMQDVAVWGNELGCVQAGRLVWNGRFVQEIQHASCLASATTTTGSAVVFAGTADGQLWQKQEAGWQRQAVPWRFAPVLALAANEAGVVAVVRDRRGTAVSIFYRDHTTNQWQPLGTQNSYGQQPRVALLNGETPRVALGIGGICWLGEAGAWTPHKIGSAAAPITGMAVDGENGRLLCTTFDALHQYTPTDWHTMPAPHDTVLVDASYDAGGNIVALSLDGRPFMLSQTS